MKANQSVNFTIDVDASIEARMVLCDYGVDRSPVWWESDDHNYADYTVTIAGVDVEVMCLPKDLRDAILECAIEACDENKWSGYDED